jgi:uncharacterized protein (DUF169 family)
METAELVKATAALREMMGLAEDPLAFFYSDRQPQGHLPSAEGRSCVIGVLARARRGETVFYDKEHFACRGGAYYLGFAPPSPDVEYFVSTGIPGKMAGERYKKSPEMVRAAMQQAGVEPAPARYAVFKPVSALAPEETPAVVICFASADELSGLVGLAGYARAEQGVICPFSSGCGAIVALPLAEARRERPRAVLGMFDPSARPFVGKDELSFAAPVAMWAEMLENAGESFLTTKTWSRIRERMEEEAPR